MNRKSILERKTKHMILRISEEQKQIVTEHLKNKKIKFSEWVRRIIYIAIENGQL